MASFYIDLKPEEYALSEALYRRSSFEEIVQLVESGAKISRFALDQAIVLRSPFKIIEYLHSKGAKWTSTSIQEAILYSHPLNNIQWIHENGADLDLNAYENIDSAITRSNIEILKYVLENTKNKPKWAFPLLIRRVSGSDSAEQKKILTEFFKD